MHVPQIPGHDHLVTLLGALPPAESPDEAIPQAAVSACLAPDSDGAATVLLIKRAEHPLDPWSGHVGLPGGRREASDRDHVTTARRETEEEVGIHLTDHQAIGVLPTLNAHRRGAPTGLRVHPVVFSLPGHDLTTLNHEVSDARWVSISCLADPAYGTTHTAETPAGPRSLPAVRIEGESGPWVLWGLTYRILSDLLAYADLRIGGTSPP